MPAAGRPSRGSTTVSGASLASGPLPPPTAPVQPPSLLSQAAALAAAAGLGSLGALAPGAAPTPVVYGTALSALPASGLVGDAATGPGPPGAERKRRLALLEQLVRHTFPPRGSANASVVAAVTDAATAGTATGQAFPDLHSILRAAAPPPTPQGPVPRTARDRATLDARADLVARHGLQLKAVIAAHQQQKQSRERFQRTYDRVVKFDGQHLQTEDMQLMVRWGRLIHTVRLPLLFTKLRDKLFVLAGDSYICTVESPFAQAMSGPGASATAAPASTPSTTSLAEAAPSAAALERRRSSTLGLRMGDAAAATGTVPSAEVVTLQWYRNLLASFVRDYVGYLESIALTKLYTATDDEGSYFRTSEVEKVKTPRTFLIRVRSM